MAELNDLLSRYFSIYHIQRMTPAQRARFDHMNTHGELTGVMRYWNQHFIGQPLPDFNTPSPDGLDNVQWEQLYNMFQKRFQEMYSDRHTKYVTNNAVQTFLQNWFDGEYGEAPGQVTNVGGRIFALNVASGPARTTLNDLYNFLNAAGRTLETPLRAHNYLPEGTSFNDFLRKLHDGEYDNDLTFRGTVQRIINYITYYQGSVDTTVWPVIAGTPLSVPGALSASLNTLSSTWDTDAFVVPDFHDRIRRFRERYGTLLQELVTNARARNAFTSGDQSEITQQLTTALNNTNYDNPSASDTYQELTPRYTDERNLAQGWKKFRSDTYENYLRKFTNPSRGTRVFFSEQAQNIISAFDKAEVKPTEGIDGILTKKDKILEKIGSSANNTKEHFNSFVKRMEEIKKLLPNAYEGALKNGKQLRAVASAYIARGIEERVPIAQLKTGLEILSVAKYGMLSSKRLEALDEATKDFSILSDANLSWNKNEGVKFVTGALDKTAKLAIRGAGRAVAAGYNLIQHHRTKIGNDVRNNEFLNASYHRWQNANNQRRTELTGTLIPQATARQTNADNDVNQSITNMTVAGITFNGNPITRANLQDYLTAGNNLDNDHQRFITNNTQIANNTARITANMAILTGLTTSNADMLRRRQIEQENADLTAQNTRLTTENTAINARHGGNVVTAYTAVSPAERAQRVDAQQLLTNYDNAHTQLEEYNTELNNIVNPPFANDQYHELIAYWDMLETRLRTHSFTLGSMEVRRRTFLQNTAQNRATNCNTNFGPIITR